MRRLCIAAAVLLAGAALAATWKKTALLQWERPTTWTDGTPMPHGDILQYQVAYGIRGGATNMRSFAGGVTTQAAVTMAYPAIWWFAVVVVGNNGNKSDWSNPVEVTNLVPSTARVERKVVTW